MVYVKFTSPIILNDEDEGGAAAAALATSSFVWGIVQSGVPPEDEYSIR